VATRSDWRGPIVVVTGLLLGLPFTLAWYLLLWHWPPSSGPGRNTVLWILILVLNTAVAVTLALAWTRRHRSHRWWPWPLGAAVLQAACYPLVDLMV
jgi:hypothetical protein